MQDLNHTSTRKYQPKQCDWEAIPTQSVSAHKSLTHTNEINAPYFWSNQENMAWNETEQQLHTSAIFVHTADLKQNLIFEIEGKTYIIQATTKLQQIS